LAASLPINQLGDMVNIGTMLAFAIVCGGVWVLRSRHPELPRPFKTPMVPLVPIIGIVLSAYLMYNLPGITWLRLIVWLAIGMVLYFGYGRGHSRVQRGDIA
jgi:APA family basic amino acid/polyamine antiporter